jgi:hypothetical protein
MPWDIFWDLLAQASIIVAILGVIGILANY